MVENMSHMFERCVYDVDMRTWDTSKVEDMSYMFSRFEGKIIGLENFNTSKVTDMSNMFEGTSMDTFCYPNFDVRKVKSMDNMFKSTHINTIDLSSWVLRDQASLFNLIMDGETKLVKLPKIDSEEEALIYFSDWDTNNLGMKVVFSKEKYYKYKVRDCSLNGIVCYKATYIKEPIEDTAKKINKTIKGAKYELFIINKDEVGISSITTDKDNFTIPSKIKIGKKAYKATYLACRSLWYHRGIFKGYCPLKVVVPSTIKEIPNYAFYNCYNLREVVIGKNVNKIGEYAFNDCKYLKKVIFKGKKVKVIGKHAFEGVRKKVVIKAPKSKLKAYKKMIKASR